MCANFEKRGFSKWLFFRSFVAINATPYKFPYTDKMNQNSNFSLHRVTTIDCRLTIYFYDIIRVVCYERKKVMRDIHVRHKYLGAYVIANNDNNNASNKQNFYLCATHANGKVLIQYNEMHFTYISITIYIIHGVNSHIISSL